MKTTLGQLVSELFEVLDRRYHDPELAALATQAIVNDLLTRPRAKLVRERKRATISPRTRTPALRKAA